jgi:ABC-type transporter lipoprotein component MlaA/pimeloyl-ACP methyl ester carboxylesterase
MEKDLGLPEKDGFDAPEAGGCKSVREGNRFPVLLAAALALCWIAGIGQAHAADDSYGYPYIDPFVATVIGTPIELQAEVPERIDIIEREVTVYERRPIPEILWYGKRLRYSIAVQNQEAPLIFLVPGVGAAYNEAKNEFLQKVFFQAGFHAVCLPSSTHPNFIPAASSSGIPGHPGEDAQDLYRVMKLIIRDIRKDVAISGFHLAGYSLGAVQAAFLADLDREFGLFGFGRVLLINPPVSLYGSMRTIDEMIRKIPGGEEKFQQFFDEAFKAFAAIYQLGDPVDFTGDFLYRGRMPNDENLAALIGLSFRLSMANMVFTADVFTNAGYIKPKNLRLSTTDSLTRYFDVADLVTFIDYFRDVFLPYFTEQTPGMTEQQLIDQLSLKRIEAFLANSPSVRLLHNADDVTLAPGEIDYLVKVFGSRAKIYPHGGHCGNLRYRVNVADTLAVFKSDAGPGEPPPVLSMEIAPVRPDSAESAPASFTAPRPAAAIMEDFGEGSVRRVSADTGAGKGREPEIVAARRSFREPSKPGLSYVIDVYDPLEPMNRALYRFNAVFDEYLFLPVVRGYEFITPYFVQDRISGVFSNVSDVRNLMNAVLQLRPDRTGKILTRLLINTTLGLAGMWDPATRLGFPMHVEDFGQTLGRYGAGPGPYLILPLFGPSSLRDTTGLAADAAAQYFYLYQPTDMDTNREWGVSYTAMNAVDTRHNIPFRYYRTGSPFEYDMLRLLYKKKRELDIEQ